MRGKGRWFKIQGSKGDIHNVRLSFDVDNNFMPEESSCPCAFGSIYRWSKKNKGKLCIHIKEACQKYQNGKIYKSKSINKIN